MAFQSFVTITRTQLPTLATQVVSSTCELLEMYISNAGAGTATIAVYDGNNGFLIPNLALPAGGIISVTSERGLPMNGGIFWSSSATGVWASLKAGIN